MGGTAKATIGLLRANLPRYFPEKYDVWDRCEAAVGFLCEDLSIQMFVPDGVATNAQETEAMLARCREQGVDFVLLVHGGFTMGDVGRAAAMSGMRLGVWTVPEPVRTGDVQLNNFVSLNMTLSSARLVRDLRKDPITWYHGDPRDDHLVNRLRTTLRAIRATVAVTGARIARIGGLAPTFYNMETSANRLNASLGLQIEEIGMPELQSRIPSIDAARSRAELTAMKQAAPVNGVSKEQMDLTARCALALRDISDEGGYAALAVSDWPNLQIDPGMHPGSAFSWLEEIDGLPCASEGDILGAVTQMAVKDLTGRPGALLDMTEPDFESGRLLMWHGGGGPLYMADAQGATWVNHPMIGREAPEGPGFGGVADYVFAPGEVSILRIARDATAYFAMGAEIVAQDPSGFIGCRGWMEAFMIDGQACALGDVVATVMAQGIEHHFVAVPGNHRAAFSEFAAWNGMFQLQKKPCREYLNLNDFS